MNNTLEQLHKIWAELGINQKLSLLLAFGGITIAMAALLMWSSRPNYQLLYGRVESKDMSEIVRLVEEQGVPYEIQAGGSSIYVPQDKVYSLRMQLASQGVPNGGGVGFEIFDKTNFGISDFVQRTNYIRAVQGELSRTISQLSGVRSSRVMVVVPENKLLAEANKRIPTASVFIDTGGATLGQEAVNSIRFLVSNAVEGLSVNEVAVIDNNGNVLSEKLKQDGSLAQASSQISFRQSLEDYYVNKIESMLSKIVGAGNVVARVAADIETETSTFLEEKFDPNGQVIRSQNISENSTTSHEASTNQGIGIQANNPGDNDGINSGIPTSSTEETRKNKNISYEINHSITEVVKMPGALKRLSAAVFIATKTVPQPGREPQIQLRSEEEIHALRNMVANTLGIALENSRELITIEEIPFPPIDLPEQTSFLNESIMEWIDVARNFTAVIIAIIMFMVFLRMVKNHKPKLSSFELMDNASSNNGSNLSGTHNITPGVTPELLNELIQKKPENVSTALKNWISTSN